MTTPLFHMPLPVIVLSGPHGSGKTVFGLTICPEETYYIDLEQSAATYAVQLPIKKRIVMAEEMSKRFPRDKHPNGWKPIDLYLWWREKIDAIKPGEYRVLMTDPISAVEDGMADWVYANAKLFGATQAQYDKMSGIKWGHMKNLYNQLINDLTAKVEVVVFVVHMKQEFAGSSPTGKRIPKGKETLDEMASLYLIMDRSKDKMTGLAPEEPRALVRKDRLNVMKKDPVTGRWRPTPILPPHLPVATPDSINAYMARGGLDYAKLNPNEQVPQEVLTDAERLALELEITNKNLEIEKAKAESNLAMERVKTMRAEALARAKAESSTSTHPSAPVASTPAPTSASAAPTPDRPVMPASAAPSVPVTPSAPAANGSSKPDRVRPELAARIETARNKLSAEGMTDDVFLGILRKRNVEKIADLTQEQAVVLVERLEGLIAQNQSAGTGGPAAPAKS